MTPLGKTLLGSMIGARVLALSAVNASAAVICSDNLCWHTHETHAYPSESRVIVHPDSWRWGPGERYAWREHEGRGCWRDDRWIEW